MWSCNWKSVRLFVRMARQWRSGFSGPESLDFAALPVVAAALGIRITERRLVDLDIMTAEALRLLRRKG